MLRCYRSLVISVIFVKLLIFSCAALQMFLAREIVLQNFARYGSTPAGWINLHLVASESRDSIPNRGSSNQFKILELDVSGDHA